IALEITPDIQGGETIDFVTISGVPNGAELSAGTDKGDGTWTLSEAQLNGLTITPPLDSHADFTISVNATLTDGSVTESDSIAVEVTADADTIVSGPDVVGDEDTAIALTITPDVQGGETIDFVTISGVPAGAALSAGTDNGNGTWTLTEVQLNGLTITPPADSNVDFDLGVSATLTDGSVTPTDSIGVTVDAVADTPDVTVSDATGAEDTVIGLNVGASVPDSTETVDFVTISGVPAGASLSAGTDNGNGSWTLTEAQLDGLTLTPPQDFNGSIELAVSATSTDGSTSDAQPLSVAVSAVPDIPVVTVAAASGAEDTSIALSISASVPNSTETVDFITISGVPLDASLSAGTDNGDGTWTLIPEQLDGLLLTPADDFNGDFDLSVTATSTDGGTSQAAPMNVDVTPVAEDVSVFFTVSNGGTTTTIPGPDDFEEPETITVGDADVQFEYEDADSAAVSVTDDWSSIRTIEATSDEAADVVLQNFVETDVTL
ncbi:MAG: hypothetical protein MI741_08665, partial [Rhodospirillales bacterium]|nr:hypothetical protein [Rhodospirillales bacterium]